ncbi:hypothetical protein O3M35_010979 [Rhynocoris fuscipes]|uniref:Uncharacterized protein n=1 Tax=Rhynocoris fuscipes TaxID=488301 RepID=A0AAW1D164_9HEMI
MNEYNPVRSVKMLGSAKMETGVLADMSNMIDTAVLVEGLKILMVVSKSLDHFNLLFLLFVNLIIFLKK